MLILSVPTGAMGQNITIGINPPKFEIVSLPGKTINLNFLLENGADPAIMEMTVSAAKASTNGVLTADNAQNNDFSFKFLHSGQESDSFFMEKNSRIKVSLEVTIPEGNAAKDYYFNITATAGSPSADEGKNQVVVRPSVVSSLAISIPERNQFYSEGKLVSFEVKPRFKFKLLGKPIAIVDSTDDIAIRLFLKNDGAHLIKPTGNITITSFLQTIKFDIIPITIPVNSQIMIPTLQNNCPLCHDNSLVAKGFFIGKVIFSADVNFGPNSKKIVSRSEIYALPLKLVLALISSLILIGLILYANRRR